MFQKFSLFLLLIKLTIISQIFSSCSQQEVTGTLTEYNEYLDNKAQEEEATRERRKEFCYHYDNGSMGTCWGLRSACLEYKKDVMLGDGYCTIEDAD